MKKMSKKELGRLELLAWVGEEYGAYQAHNGLFSPEYNRETRTQIRKLIEEKPKVTTAFVEKWGKLIYTEHHRHTKAVFINMLKEAGVEVADK